MSSLLYRSGWRFMGRHRWQGALTVIGITLGVAVVVAVDLANYSARKAFDITLESVSGNISHQILGGPNGIDEVWFTRLRTELGFYKSAPVVTEQVRVKEHAFTLVGADPISEWSLGRHTQALAAGTLDTLSITANAVMLSERAADKLELKEGDRFYILYRGQQYEVQLTAIFHSENPAATEGLILIDIAAAQTLLDRSGTLDRIDLIATQAQVSQLENWLPDNLKLVVSESRNTGISQMSEAFHTNLSAMSLLALLVGALLIYNTMTFSVLRRRLTLGIYRSIGVTRAELFRLVLGESLLLGLLGTALGLVLGLALAHFLVHLVTRTVDDLYFSLHVTRLFIGPLSLLKGTALGMGLTTFAALLPAREAANNRPVTTQQRSFIEQRWRGGLPLLFVVGIGLMIIGYGLTLVDHPSLLQGFAALTLLILGFCLLVPLTVVAIITLLSYLLPPFAGTIVRMAIRGVSAGISRTGLAIVALTVAISATVGVSVMIHSFRHSVVLWLEQSLTGDVYISQPGPGRSRASGALPESLIGEITRLEGVADFARSHTILAETGFGPIRILAIEPNASRQQQVPLSAAVAGAREGFIGAEGVFVSEPLAYHRNLELGDRIELKTDRGDTALVVLGVFRDYSSSRGRIMMSLKLYRALWQDPTVSGLTLYRSPEHDQQALLDAIDSVLAVGYQREKSSGGPTTVYRATSRSEVRDITLTIFDRTFAVTHVLRILAILVAFVGVVSALLALQLERDREFAILRATGMSPPQMTAMVLLQTALMGLLAGVLALPLGLLMSDVLIDVINRSAFGWSMQRQTPEGVLSQALVLAIGAALLAGAYPAWRAATVAPAQALRSE